MRISQAIKRLQAVVDEAGDRDVGIFAMIEALYGARIAAEHRRRQAIVRRMIRAKVEAGYSRKVVFFDVVWPEALEALRERRRSGDADLQD